MKDVKVLCLPSGKEPFKEWFDKFDITTRSKIRAYIDRVALGGGKKNVKHLGQRVFEIKIDFGPGYRVYFGEDGKTIILLLIGGDKSSQKRDIKKAKELWSKYVSK